MHPISFCLGAKSISSARVARLMKRMVIRGVLKTGTQAAFAALSKAGSGLRLREKTTQGMRVAKIHWYRSSRSLGERDLR